MSADFDTANDEILTLFKTAWDTTGHPALYENLAGEPPTTPVPWARISLRHGTGGQTALSGADGTRRYDRIGILTVQIFIANGKGLSEGYTLGKIVVDAFEGKTTPSQVWFRDVVNKEIGPDGEWFQFNVTAEFVYDEIK